METVEVKIPAQNETSYPIIIGEGLLNNAFEYIAKNTNAKRFLLVTNTTVDALYGEKFTGENVEKIVLPGGEEYKTVATLNKIIDRALELKLERKDAIIALGGGVIGDMAGFAAAIYQRGIDFIQVPTTLLACVDSSVGGKTAVNSEYGKNLIGTFYQPKAVFINPKFIKTLDEQQFKSGLGEVIKYSFIEHSCKCPEELNLTNFLNEKYNEINNRDERILSVLIEMCIKLKKSVVEQDEKESDLRRILNFGHTYGHAIEKINNYKKYTHGEAVVEGIKYAFKLALQKNIIDKNYNFFAMDIIEKYNYRQIPQYNRNKMHSLMSMDKKASSGKITFVLPTDYSKVDMFEFSKEEI